MRTIQRDGTEVCTGTLSSAPSNFLLIRCSIFAQPIYPEPGPRRRRRPSSTMVVLLKEDSAKSASAPVMPRVQGPLDPPAYSVAGDESGQAAQSSSERDAMLGSSHHPHHHHHRPDLEGLPHHHPKHVDHHQRKSFFSRHGSDGSSGHGHGHGRSPGQAAMSRFCHALLIAVAAYLFFGFLVRSIVELARHGRVYLVSGHFLSYLRPTSSRTVRPQRKPEGPCCPGYAFLPYSVQRLA